ncbi:MAG: hypothetical protein AAF962_06465 [Actinomycetota bacterium]
MPKWVFPLLLLFVIFFVLSSPETAGPQARDFFGWIGDQAAAAGTFLDGLFGDDAPATSSEPATTTSTTAVDPSGVTANNDEFNT